MIFAPLEGWQQVEVLDRYAAADYARCARNCPTRTSCWPARSCSCRTISVPTARLALRSPPGAEARRLVERFAWYDTPKHGSWPDSAECELSVLSSQCLDCRFPDKESLIKVVAAWQNNRNKKHAKATWQFTTADAASS